MSTLKQPQLGQTILALRQEKKITQEELVERCNVNVRTLQRIEAGEVTPRDSTLRIILEALDYDFGRVARSAQLRHRQSMLRIAWISGTIYFVIGILEAFLDFQRFEPGLPIYFNWLYTVAKMVILSTYVFFMLGYVEVGKHFELSLTKISAYLMIGSMSIMEFYDVVSLYSAFTEEEFLMIKGIEGVAFAGIDIAFGIALFKLAKHMGDVAKIASILHLIAGFCFLTFILGILGLFILLPATILEIIVVFKLYDQVSKSLQTDELE